MKIESMVKQDQIIEAAIRRFSHFGIAKTTLMEIAEDMSVTKQALSYYFPDKQSLVNAVIQRLIMDYSESLKTEIEQSPTVEEALLKLTEVKGIFFEKYFMLAIQAEHLEIEKNHSLKKIISDKESGILTILFEKGVKTGELKPLDSPKTAELFLETLYAFSRCVKEKGLIPDANAFKELLHMQQEVIKLFYQGLKSQSAVK